MRLSLASALMLAAASSTQAGSVVSTFTNVPIPAAVGAVYNSSTATPQYPGVADGFSGGPDGFTVDGNAFNNDATYDPAWNGWAFSNQDAAFSGQAYGQFLAMPSKVVGATPNTYAIASSYTDPAGIWSTEAYIDLAAGRSATSILLTNTEYVYRAITEGYGYGGGQFTTDGQYFSLKIEGSGASDGLDHSRIIELASFQGGSLSILSTWQFVDLTFLGDSTRINFSFLTNVNNQYGPLIPTFAAFDDLVTSSTAAAVPEPSAWLLMGLGGAGAFAARRRRA